jgi:hypothetical protein
MRKFEVIEQYNGYLKANVYVVILRGYCLLPDAQHGSFSTLEEAKEYITQVRATGGVVYSE